MKKLIIITLLATASNAFSQDWPVKKMVTDKKAKKLAFVQTPAFTLAGDKQLRQRGTYQVLKLNTSFTNQLLEQRPEAIQVAVPLSNSETINCELVKSDLGNIKFTQNNNDAIQNVRIPVMYRGIVSGETNKNTVTLTVNEDYLSLIAVLGDKTVQVTKGDEKDKSAYRLYNSKKVQFPLVNFDCGTITRPISQAVNAAPSPVQNGINASQDKCVNVFVDCFDSLYQSQGNSFQQTVNFVYELFNEVATGYANEQINIQITTINVWTTADPYRGDNRSNALADLAANYKDNFWGNICVGLDFSTNGAGRSGLAGEIGKVKAVSPNACPAYAVGSNEFCYTDLNYNVSVQNFPVGPNTTAPQIYLVMHEMGHLLGAHHTKWCGWKLTSNPDSYGTLDSCGTIEPINSSTPACPQGPPPPLTGATIMSYCVSGNAAGEFVNYNNGFGTLPGAAIRDFVSQSSCIPNCLVCLVLLDDKSNDALAFNINSPAVIPFASRNKNNSVPFNISRVTPEAVKNNNDIAGLNDLPVK
jgi:Metallo-peptidase family M12